MSRLLLVDSHDERGAVWEDPAFVCMRALHAACALVRGCGSVRSGGCLRGVGWDSSSSASVTFPRQAGQQDAGGTASGGSIH